MTDPAHWLTDKMQQAAKAALGPELEGFEPAVRRSEFGDYQANGVMGLAKRLKRPPRDLARALIEQLDVSEACSSVEIAGPGFINFTLSNEYLAGCLDQARGSERLMPVVAEPEKVVVDYSHPNVAKEMHVGHLRTTVIGDALVRVFEYLGHEVLRQNHIGDWGTPFGMLIEHLLDVGEQQAAEQLSMGQLKDFYQQARQKFDGDSGFADRARRRVVALQGGDETTLALWRLLVDKSKEYFCLVYDKLGITLRDEHIAGESFYNPSLAEVVQELEEKGLAQVSDGAVCVFPEGFKGKEGAPLPLIVRKKDGGYSYATTDLAAIRYRSQTLKADRVVYVVGAPQQQHLAMVFATALQAGWLGEGTIAEHVPFGSVLGEDRKLMKTRAGSSTRLIDLIDEAIERAGQIIVEKNPELDETARQQVARQIGTGALKYADLSSDRVKDYVFDWGRMLAFDGNTAPYVQYAHARLLSIFRKTGEASGERPSVPLELSTPAERALALELVGFSAAVRSVLDGYQPHKLCGYLYGLANAVMTFYEKCPVMRAETEALKASRLALAAHAARVLQTGLFLLGIEAPERM